MADGTLPNEKWSKESVELFNKLNGMSGDWKKLHQNMSVGTDGSKKFELAVSELGKFFEFAFFLNAKLQLVKAVVQFGSYTRGHHGLVHGGAIATILDVALGGCVIFCGHKAVIGNLNIDYKRPIPLNTTTLVEANIDKVERRKIFASAAIKTVDGTEIYAKATSVFIIAELIASL